MSSGWLTYTFQLISLSLAQSLHLPLQQSPWPVLTYYRRLQVDHDSPGHMLAIASLTEKGGEGVVIVDLAGLSAKGPICLDAMFQAEEFPAGIANLNSSLTHVD